ncbi:LCP family protein [Kitasatospora sp. NBC_01266]|uniref:LCP family protein n=1 Tax=Kitasatospora sp. NBC_01266 TaxID=2903572 RepID=UPI002E3541D6|nr:LCP family protein [Kitasatospora sp. NBC_01266]
MAEHRSRRAARTRRTGPLRLAGRTLACGVCLAVLGTTGFTWYTYRSLTTGMTTSNALEQVKQDAPKKLDNSVNLLLIGLDSRKDMNGNDLPKQFVQDELNAGSSQIGGYNTNSLILLHIPAGGGKVEAVSIPRDDYVMTYNGDGSEQGMHKIKEAYGKAKEQAAPGLQAKGLKGAALEQAGRDAGRAATIETVQKFLDVPIDHFAEVNLLGFYDIAQAVQPITVCLNAATKDPAEDLQGSGADFHAGLNSLNASQALSFVRQRHNLAGGDFDRTHRQQAFIAAVEYKLRQDGLFGDLGRMQQLFDAVKKDVVIDDKWNLLDFIQQAPDLTGGNVEFNTLPVKALQPPVVIPDDGPKPVDVNYVDEALNQRTVKVLFGYSDATSGSASASASTAASAPVPSPAASSPSPFASPSARSGHRAGATPTPTPIPTPAAIPTPSPSVSDPAAGMVMQGKAVQGDNGIPCVD